MEPAGGFALTKEQWLAVEQISDLLSEAVNLQPAFESGLALLLKVIGNPGGAIFLPRFCEHIQRDITIHNAPLGWEHELENPGSLLRCIIERVMETGQPVTDAAVPGLAAVVPIQIGSKTPGAAVISGRPLPPEAIEACRAALRPFGRAAAVHSLCSGRVRERPTYLDLLRSRNTLRTMFDSLPLSIYIIDKTYTIVAVNFSRSRRLGLSPRQIVRRNCYAVLYGLSEPCEGCHAFETFLTGQNTLRLLREQRPSAAELDETFVEWEINTFPIYDEQAAVSQVILIEQDVTEKRILEANLIQSEKLAAVGQLAAGIAHEINNPLTAIIANTQILRHDLPDSSSDWHDSLNLIETAGTRASQVISNLLGIARKETNDFEPIDLNETLHDALSLVKHELAKRPVQVNLNLAAGMPQLTASKDQLQGVWVNLILNAIDALDKENCAITITTRYTLRGFEVIIQDNGRGIAPEYIGRVFEPFFTMKTARRGTGLGLPVCMRAIRQHGGTITVKSQPGKWTRFTVNLPAECRVEVTRSA